jgi:DNA primase
MARPLLERIPPGIFRELLAEEVAKTVGLNPDRLALVLGDAAAAGARPASPSANLRADAHHDARAAGENRHAGQASAGRRNLVRQAIHLLVHHPEIADKVSLNPALATLDRPGIPLLVELIEELSGRPCASTGALLERWRDRPDVEHLAKLAMQECVPNAAGAAKDLAGAVQQLCDEATRLRTDFLLRKAGLTEAEKAELQGLLGRRAPVDDGK